MEYIIGQKIKEFRPMTNAEIKAEGWHSRTATVIVLENGTKIYPSSDEEGNDSGVLFGVTPEGKQVSFY